MGFIILLVIILFFAGLIFINVKINNLKYRAKQHVLKNTGISSSDINATISSGFEKAKMDKFLKENPNFTEESVKELLKTYSTQLFARETREEFSQKVCEKMLKDSKLDKMQTMEFRRANINYYANSRMKSVVIYTDTKDEYNVYLECGMNDGKLYLNDYRILKGAVIGF